MLIDKQFHAFVSDAVEDTASERIVVGIGLAEQQSDLGAELGL